MLYTPCFCYFFFIFIGLMSDAPASAQKVAQTLNDIRNHNNRTHLIVESLEQKMRDLQVVVNEIQYDLHKTASVKKQQDTFSSELWEIWVELKKVKNDLHLLANK